jgi:uncharacterized protein YraI
MNHYSLSPVLRSRASRVTGLILMALVATVVSHRANAQEDQVYTNGAVTVRTGPDWGYPAVAQWPSGVPVMLDGCLDDRSWCEVSWGPQQGWVMSHGLVAMEDGDSVLVSHWNWPVPLVVYDGAVHPHPWHHDERWHDHDDGD